VHRTIKLEEAPAVHTRLAQVLVEHHRHIVAIYGFVKDSIRTPQPADRQMEALEHVKRLEACADWLELLESRLKPHVRLVLHLYLGEVAKVARVVHMHAVGLETDEDRLNAAIQDVLRVLEPVAEPHSAVDKRHSDTAV
jgi:hypothetical protein